MIQPLVDFVARAQLNFVKIAPVVRCITIRENIQRTIMVTEGLNVLVGAGPARIAAENYKVMFGEDKQRSCPYLWDGKVAERIVNVLAKELL